MKTHQTICELLGLKQQEMAMLLGVHRTQWSMFELGKRSLPKEALMKLHEILTLNQSLDKMDADETSVIKPIGNFTKEELETLLKENEYQCLATERKLNYQHEKLQSLLRAEQIVSRLQNVSAQNNSQTSSVLQMIEKRIQKSLENNDRKEISFLQQKAKLLQLEKKNTGKGIQKTNGHQQQISYTARQNLHLASCCYEVYEKNSHKKSRTYCSAFLYG